MLLIVKHHIQFKKLNSFSFQITLILNINMNFFVSTNIVYICIYRITFYIILSNSKVAFNIPKEFLNIL